MKNQRPDEVEYYRGPDGLWRWRVWSPNGRNVTNGSEGYANKANAQRAFRRLKEKILTRSIIER